MTPTEKGPPPEIPGWYDWHQWNKAIVEAMQPTTNKIGFIYVEVGCFKGKSTAALCRLVGAAAAAIHVIAVDTFCGGETGDPAIPAESFRAEFDRNIAAAFGGTPNFLHVHQGKSVEVAAAFAPDACDVIFIDADHSCAAVKADLSAWWPKLKSGGIMAGHDINTYHSVWEAVHHFGQITGIVPKIHNDQNIWEFKKP